VVERLDAVGEVMTPLDENSVAAMIDQLTRAEVRAVAVCLLHAYRNPVHERRVAELVAARLPQVAVSLSSDLASEFREFPRACTAIVNAGLMPEVSSYLTALDRNLEGQGLAGSRLVMQSNGGIAEFSVGAERPVFLIESGPAAGVVGAAHLANLLGEPNIVSFDMGGTTAKLGLVQGGEPSRVHEFEIDIDSNHARQWFAGASGYPILTPAVDMVEIGTGGGSKAWIDDGGQLRVGPISAGSSPGPACYGQGGEDATITDADLVLGRLNPSYFLGGEMMLDREAAESAVGALARRLGLDKVDAAAGIVRIADAAMAQALRVVSVQRGYDPRSFKLVAFGGAGPLHAASLAEDVGISTVFVPPRPGLASAFGLLVADLKHDFAVTRVERLDKADPEELDRAFAALGKDGRATLERERVAQDQMRFDRALDVRYVGQSYHLTISWDGSPKSVAERFNDLHRNTYGYAEPREPCEIVTLRLTAAGMIGKPRLGASATAAKRGAERRKVFFGGIGFVDCAVHHRLALDRDAALAGPAVIEEQDSTVLVPPRWHARVVVHDVLVMERT
jgi:N-methylhydantoinase A